MGVGKGEGGDLAMVKNNPVRFLVVSLRMRLRRPMKIPSQSQLRASSIVHGVGRACSGEIVSGWKGFLAAADLERKYSHTGGKLELRTHPWVWVETRPVEPRSDLLESVW